MKLLTATGKLTAYAFASGYVEQAHGFTLSRESGIYHVKGFDQYRTRCWFTFHGLKDARKCLREVSKPYINPAQCDLCSLGSMLRRSLA